MQSPEVDAYIAAAEPALRPRLEALRAALRAVAPAAVERMAYGMPTLHQGENIVHYAAFGQHIGLYPGPEAIEHFAPALAGLRSSKGAVQLPHEAPLPLALCAEITAWRVAQVEAAPPRAGKKAPEALRDPGPLRFSAALHKAQAAGAACFVDFPWELKATFGKGNLVPVRAVWDGAVVYRGVLAMMGGAAPMLLCRSDVVAALGKGPGDTVEVELHLDLEPRPVELHPDLAAALAAAPSAEAAFGRLSPSAQRDYAAWVADAKKDATRAARVEATLAGALAGKRLKG
jgi:uncharacterized protein YdhG (YjbR/CyaY superfamily)